MTAKPQPPPRMMVRREDLEAVQRLTMNRAQRRAAARKAKRG